MGMAFLRAWGILALYAGGIALAVVAWRRGLSPRGRVAFGISVGLVALGAIHWYGVVSWGSRNAAATLAGLGLVGMIGVPLVEAVWVHVRDWPASPFGDDEDGGGRW